jgi:hypothetical protein
MSLFGIIKNNLLSLPENKTPFVCSIRLPDDGPVDCPKHVYSSTVVFFGSYI